MGKIKIVLSVLVCLFCMIQCMSASAEETKGPAQAAGSAKSTIQDFMGKIESVSPIDPDRGVDSGSIIVTDSTDNDRIFIINSGTKISNKTSNTIDSHDINLGDTVKVEYTTTDEGTIASSIHVAQ